MEQQREALVELKVVLEEQEDQGEEEEVHQQQQGVLVGQVVGRADRAVQEGLQTRRGRVVQEQRG